MPPSENFWSANNKKKVVWFDKGNYAMLGVYPEISFIGTDGVERIKIRNGSIRNDYLDLSKEKNLEFILRILSIILTRIKEKLY